MQIKVLYKNNFFSTLESPDQLSNLLSIDDSLDESLFSFDQADYKAWAKKHFAEFATKARKAVMDNADPYKISGWSNKEQRAHRFKTTTSSAGDLAAIDTEISLRNKNETRAELVAKQLAKADLYSKIMGKIDGREELVNNEIDATTTNAELDTVIANRDAEGVTFIANLMELVV